MKDYLVVVMTMTFDDFNCFIGNPVNQPVLLCDPAAPEPGKFAFEQFGFAKTFEDVFLQKHQMDLKHLALR